MNNIIKKCFEEKRYDELKQLLIGNEDLESKVYLARVYNLCEEYQNAYDILQNIELDDLARYELMNACNGLSKFETTKSTFNLLNNKNVDAYIMLFQANFGLKLYEENISVLEKAVEFEEKLGLLHYFFYLTYTHLENYEKAYDHAKLSYEYDENLFGLRNLMSACLVLQKFDEVLNLYQGENHSELKWFNFVALTQSKQHEKAIEFGLELLKEHPDLTYVPDGLAFNYFMLEEYAKAIDYAKFYEEFPDANLRLRSLDLIRTCYEKLGDQENVLKYVEKIQENSDEYLPVYSEVEKLYEEGKLEEIVEKLEGIDTPTALRQKTVALYQLQRFEEVAKNSKILATMYDDPEVLKIAVISYLNIEDYQSAKEELLRMEAKEIALDFVYSHLLSLYTQEGNMDEAIHYGYLGKEYEPTSFEPYARLAQIYSAAGRDQEAIETLLAARSLTDNESYLEWVRRNLGVVYLKTEQLEKAYSEFKEADCFNVNDLWVGYHAGLVCMHLGKFDEAITYFEFLKSQERYGDEIVYRLALCYLEMNQNQKFQAIYEECERLAENNEENTSYLEIVNNRAFRGE